MLATIYTIKVLLKQMVNRDQRSSIVVTSSGMRLMPFSGVATYSATKAFDSWMALALSDELRYMGTKVDVMNFDCG